MKQPIDHTKRINDQLKAKLQEIVAAMDAGTCAQDFEMPFSTIGSRPYNPATGHAATGTNALIAMMMGHTHYSTYDGWQKLGYQVTGKADMFLSRPNKFKIDADKSPSGEDEYRLGGFVSFAVWGFDTVTLRTPETDAELKREPKHKIPAKPWTPPAIPKRSDVETRETVDAFINNLGANISHAPEGRAFYRPSTDSVTMPVRELFKATSTSTATEAYYSTFLHEMTHWTGHKSRCDRSDDRSKRGYAFEELVAEIGAMLMCADLGVTASMRLDHVSYIAGWLRALDSDQKYIFSAGKLAQDACEHMHSLQPENQTVAA
jgi:antirestriction protein ArdC